MATTNKTSRSGPPLGGGTPTATASTIPGVPATACSISAEPSLDPTQVHGVILRRPKERYRSSPSTSIRSPWRLQTYPVLFGAAGKVNLLVVPVQQPRRHPEDRGTRNTRPIRQT